MSYIEFLRCAIKDRHGCDSRHVKTVFVTEELRGVAWEGEVDVFELRNHPTAARCYAWWQGDEEPAARTGVQVMLAVPPVTTPESAIRWFLEGFAQSKQP